MLSPIPEWSRNPRLAFALLLALLVIGETTALALYSQRIGHGNEHAYYTGTPEDSDLEMDAPIYYRKSLVELLEVAHPHAFGLTMFFAMLAFLATAIPIAPKAIRIWTVSFAASLMAFMAVPFVIRFITPAAAGGYGIFGALISLHVYLFVAAGIWALRQKLKIKGD